MKQTSDNEKISWDKLLRYRLIEIFSLWEGRVTTNHLQNTFGVKRQTASNYLKHYREAVPQNLCENKSLKGYAPTENFRPAFTDGTVDEYLQLLSQNNDAEGIFHCVDLPDSPTEVLRVPARNVSPKIVRDIVKACEESRRIDICYASMTNPAGEDRIIHPKTLVYSGYRWHIRAYCEKSLDYRDFLLNRILEDVCFEESTGIKLPLDTKWHTFVDIMLKPHPSLSPAQQTLVIREHGLNQDPIRTRAALAQYLLDLMQISVDDLADTNPSQHPIVIDNLEALKPYLFKRKLQTSEHLK